VPEAVPHVVHGVPDFGAKHSPGDAVPERVGAHVRRVAPPVCELWLEVSRSCETFHDVVYRLAGKTAAFLGHEDGLDAALALTIVEVGPESLLGSKRSATVQGKRLRTR